MTTPFPTATVSVVPTMARSLQLLYPEVRNFNMPDNVDNACDTLLDYLRTGKADETALEGAMTTLAFHYIWGKFFTLPCTAESPPFQHLMKIWDRAKDRADMKAVALTNFVWRPFRLAEFAPYIIEGGKDVTLWVAEHELATA